MSRFYQTSKGEHIDYMFKPNYEMMESVLMKKNEDVDNILANSNILSSEYDKVQHLNIEADVQRVAGKKKEYDKRIGQVTDQVMENVLDASRYAPQLEDLKKEITEDLTTGETSKVINRYKSFQNMLEENKGLMESDPTTYNQMLNYYYGQVKKGAELDPNFVFNPEKFVGRPELFGKDFNDIMKNLKANSYDQAKGMYLINKEYVDAQRVREIALNELFSDPNYQGYVTQQIMIGESSGLIDGISSEKFVQLEPSERDKYMIKPIIYFNNATGKEVSQTDYENMTAEDRAKVSQMANPSYRFSSDLLKAENIFSYEKIGIKENAVATKAADRASKERIAAANNAIKIQLEQLKAKNAKDKLQFEFDLAIEYEKAMAKGDTKKASELANVKGGADVQRVFDPKTGEVFEQIPANKATANKDRETLNQAVESGSIKYRKDENGIPRLQINSSHPAYDAYLRLQQSKRQIIEKVPAKETITFEDVNGKPFTVNKREFLTRHGDRSTKPASYAKTAKEMMQEKSKEIVGNTKGVFPTIGEVEPFQVRKNYAGSKKDTPYQTSKTVTKTNPSTITGDFGKSREIEEEITVNFDKLTTNVNTLQGLSEGTWNVATDWYRINQSQETERRVGFNPIKEAESISIEGTIALNPEAFIYYKNGQLIDLKPEEVKVMLNTMESNLMATGLNQITDIGFMTDQGIVILPDKSDPQMGPTVKKMALQGVSEDSYLYQNEVNNVAKEIEQKVLSLGEADINYQKTDKGVVKRVSNFNHRGVAITFEEIQSRNGFKEIVVLDADNDQPLFESSGKFTDYVTAVTEINNWIDELAKTK